MREPHAHQTAAIESLRQALRSGNRRPVIQAPTGFGKTLLAAWIIQGALAKSNRVIFTCPAISLIDQTAREFHREGITQVGIMQANHPGTDPTQPVQICSVQTLVRRKIPAASLVIVDECHRMHKGVTAWMGWEEWAKVPFVGLSATPWTKGLGKLYDGLIIASTTRELIEKGFLSPYRAFAPAHPDLTGVKTVAGDYHEGQLSAAMQKKTLVGDIVTTWLARAADRPTFVFAVDCAHARAIQRSFEQAGVECGYLDAHSTREEREEVRKAFALFTMRVVVNVGILTTGIDWDVRCIVLARPTKSEILYVQIMGRGLRNALGKTDLLILDHSDTTLRLGFVDQIHHDELNDGRIKETPEKTEPKPRECPECAYLSPAGSAKCESCGYEFPHRLANVETVGGEIIELGDRIRDRRNREQGWDEKEAFMAGLKRYRLLTGKREGWVAYSYKDRFGVWPNDPRVKYCAPSETVPMEVSQWIKSRQIAWRHRKA